MNIGLLTHKMTIETPVLTPDGGGGFTVAWEHLDDVYAAVTELGGQIVPSQPCRVVIHYRDDMGSKMRLREDETVYNIVSLRDPDGGKTWLEIIAQMK